MERKEHVYHDLLILDVNASAAVIFAVEKKVKEKDEKRIHKKQPKRIQWIHKLVIQFSEYWGH